MNRDLNRVSVWCDLWGMKLNAGKTKTVIVSRPRTVHPQLVVWCCGLRIDRVFSLYPAFYC